MYQLGAKLRELAVGDCSRLLKAVKLLKLVGGAEPHNMLRLVARLLSLLVGSLELDLLGN